MKSYLLILYCGYLLTSCHVSRFTKQTKLPPGLYRGGREWNLFFLKVSNDSAYADFINMGDYPGELHSDTFLFQPFTQTWKSKKGEILRQSKKFILKSGYTCEICIKPANIRVEQKLRASKKLTQTYIDAYKNYAYVNLQHRLYIRKDTVNRRRGHYYFLKEKHCYFENLHLMPHEKLLVEYEKYRLIIEKPLCP